MFFHSSTKGKDLILSVQRCPMDIPGVPHQSRKMENGRPGISAREESARTKVQFNGFKGFPSLFLI